METLTKFDNPGDCQSENTVLNETGNENKPLTTENQIANREKPTTRTTKTATIIVKHATSPPTPTAATNKLKSQQQHQFRAPQQFVKHKKTSSNTTAGNTSTSSSSCNTSTTASTTSCAATTTDVAHTSLNTSNNNKKNKCWNKRQNRSSKHNTQNTANNASNTTTTQLETEDTKNQLTSTSKADLENIQNLKNQQQFNNHQHHGGGGGTTNTTSTGQGGLPASLSTLTSEKLGYGHGHLKQQQQQLHKKPLPPHRGGGHNNHHHHILCAGSAHNTLGSGGPAAVANAALVAGQVSASNLTCCHINGCSSHAGKDLNAGSNNSSTNSSATLHICCLRSKFFLPDKRPRKGNFIPPTKFLLGGNISDPLNLNSLQNEVSSASSNNNTPATTPRQSPITTPPKVEVIIPPNIHDPLHLLDPVDSMEYEKQLTSPMKRGLSLQASLALGLRAGQAKSHKHRHRKNRKPKRRRYDSFNSTTSTMTDSLDEPNHTTLILNSSTTTEKGVSMLSVSMDLEMKNKQQETNSAGGSGGEDEDLSSEHNLHSPQEQQQQQPLSLSHNIPITTSDIINTTANISEELCGNSKITLTLASPPAAAASFSLPEKNQEILTVDMTNVAGLNIATTSGGILNAAADVVLTARERACRDLRLDLISTTTGSGSNTTSCGSSVVSSGGGGNCGGGGSRKRKISESNNSQKNKKYFRNDSMDKIVSPVVPQPGAWKRPPRTTATGARKSQSRRSTSISETITDLSPIEETSKALVEEIPRDDTPELTNVEALAETGLPGSPLSAVSGSAIIAKAETDKVTSELIAQTVDTTNALILAENVKKELKTTIISPKFPQPKFCADGKQYQYGNYDSYAGLRHLNEFMDIRLQVFLQYPELFKNKDILDIGCNVGHMTISVARKLAPKSILGIDIDKELIARARRNLSMYVRIPNEIVKKELMEVDEKETKDLAEVKQKKGRRRRKKKKPQAVENLQQQHHHHHHHGNYAHWQQFHHHLLHYHLLHHHHHHHHHHHLYLQQEAANVDTSNFFPISFPLSYGGITGSNTKATSPQNIESQSPASTSTTTRSTPGHPATSSASNKANTSFSTSTHHKGNLLKSKNDFPNNVYFRQTNYVLKDENLLANDTQQYDLILCLSLTKWIHLNFGDAGLKSAFKRMFNQLRPSGKLILEAQNWASYKKKKNLTENIYNNYHNIEFYPNKFHEYLLSSEVGFSHSYTLGIPKHLSKGFSRPIQLYAKGDYTPNHVRWSDAYYPQTPFEAYRGIYATMPPRPGMHSSYPVISSSRSQTYDTPHYTGGGGASGPYSCRQTPMHQPSTSQYYNPLESDSYQPSYDMEYLNHMYVFASPLYQTVWSPPTSMRKSSSHTPVFGSVRDADEGDGTNMAGGSYHKHVYPPNDDTSSPNANAINAFNSIRDPDTDDSNQQRPHVYATNCGESSTSPHPNVNPNDAEAIEEVLMLDDDRCDLSEA